MSRPKCCRRIGEEPICKVFRPVGAFHPFLEEVVLSLDEFEAVRLADFEGLYHEEAAERMDVSRQTFGRIVGAARRKIAGALVAGSALIIENSESCACAAGARTLRCRQCSHTWDAPRGTTGPDGCPACSSRNILRSDAGDESGGSS